MATKTKAKLNLRPLADRVILQRAEAEDKTAGGILLPESAKDKPKEGKIVAVGEGYAGTEVKVSGEEYLIMNESDILAIIG
ncbi:MAG: co-chaperone GroES [Deltaproteobacteria bacterium]|nr:co-chaperone GroES [Deltaproteobacteria bacterium]